jgi:hypothetical protein
MPTCSFYEAGPIPRCHAVVEPIVPPITWRERRCLSSPARCPIYEAAVSSGDRVPSAMYGLLTLPIVAGDRRGGRLLRVVAGAIRRGAR